MDFEFYRFGKEIATHHAMLYQKTFSPRDLSLPSFEFIEFLSCAPMLQTLVAFQRFQVPFSKEGVT
jgi:hypothetical protein